LEINPTTVPVAAGPAGAAVIKWNGGKVTRPLLTTSPPFEPAWRNSAAKVREPNPARRRCSGPRRPTAAETCVTQPQRTAWGQAVSDSLAPARTSVQCGIFDFGVSQSRSAAARFWSRALSSGAAVVIFASVSASMDRIATARGTNGWSRYGEFFISVPDRLSRRCPRTARAPGARNASGGAGFFPLSGCCIHHTPGPRSAQ
jgi:hypothetical protein